MSATDDEANLDPYAALGLTPAATEKEIKSAYRKVSLKCHPDRVRWAPRLTPRRASDPGWC